ncbi:D-fructose-6-phosphate amidotransferase [Synechococcus sp. WH 7805]|nr:D-fructose-6-phosphate amidotransferase [Synechococcus sp. WH 7805]
MVMHLQGEAGSGLYGDALYLPAAVFDYAGVVAPGPVDLAMGLAL